MARGPDLTLDLRRMDFGGVPLFVDLTLEVPSGQVIALLGPSGVGKTTLLRIIAGAETGFDGTMRVDGRAARDAPVPGYLFQDARLLPWLTVAGNILAVAPEIGADRLAAHLASVGLSGLEDAFPHALSGGMLRRLALVRALSVHPGLLLLDEPFVSLDRAAVRDLQALFRQVFSRGHPTVVLVSHDPEDAARLADRVVVLSGRPARIVADRSLPSVPAARVPTDIAALTADLAALSLGLVA